MLASNNLTFLTSYAVDRMRHFLDQSASFQLRPDGNNFHSIQKKKNSSGARKKERERQKRASLTEKTNKQHGEKGEIVF